VAGQLALSLVLLVAGALLLRGLTHAREIDPGFDPDHLAVLSFNLKMNGYSLEQATIFQRRMLERLRRLPEVERASLVSRTPLGSDYTMEGIRIPGIHAPGDEPSLVDSTTVDPDYFAALGLSPREGRTFTDADDERSPRVVIVNQAFARRYWPGKSAVGQRIYTEGFDGPAFEVIGVVPDYKVRDLGEEPRPYLHFAWRQQPDRKTTALVRTAGPAASVVAGLRRAVLELEPAVVFSDQGTVADLLRVTLTPARAGAVVLSTFAALALMLAAVGLYGVVSYSVAQRTREVGVRMALGAEVGDVLRLVIGKGLRLAALGVAIGAGAAAVLSRVLSSLLYGVSAWDPLAFATAAAVLLAVAFVASLVPSRRAARVDPTVALRYE
jgi:predicted permease